MNFRVIRPFDFNGVIRMPGQILEMDIVRAGKLRSMGLIGQVAPEHAVLRPSQKAVQPRKPRAVREPTEKRFGGKKSTKKRSSRKKKEAPAPEIPKDTEVRFG